MIDPLAERRFAYAQAAAAEGDFAAAADVLAQALELAPNWAEAWGALGEARERLGDRAGALKAYRAALAADPADTSGAGPRLARLEARAVEALPPAYVARLFDDYAPRFDQHLREALGYRGPELVAQALERWAPGRRFAWALDLGCGSGLAGAALRGKVDRLIGVDLSPGMIAQARAAGLYDELQVDDLVNSLESASGADLIVAADAFVYLGDLRPVLAAMSAAMAPGGMAVFTIESGEAAFALSETLRFRHSDAHLREAAAGFDVLALEPVATRREARQAATGRLVVLAKPLAAPPPSGAVR